MKPTNTDLIQALTPIFLATVGAIIGVSALFSSINDTKLTADMGLSGTAIAGASGLAQSSSNEKNK